MKIETQTLMQRITSYSGWIHSSVLLQLAFVLLVIWPGTALAQDREGPKWWELAIPIISFGGMIGWAIFDAIRFRYFMTEAEREATPQPT